MQLPSAKQFRYKRNKTRCQIQIVHLFAQYRNPGLKLTQSRKCGELTYTSKPRSLFLFVSRHYRNIYVFV